MSETEPSSTRLESGLILSSLNRLREENKQLRKENEVFEEELAQLHVVLVKMETLYKLFMERFDGCAQCNPVRHDDGCGG